MTFDQIFKKTTFVEGLKLYHIHKSHDHAT